MVSSFLDLIRIGPCLQIGLFTGLCLAFWGRAPALSFFSLLPALALACLAAGGYALNDRYDVKTDRINAPARPLPSGRLSQRFALRAGFGLLAAGLALCAAINAAAFSVGLLDAALIIFYARNSKRLGWLKTITVCWLHASIFVFVAAVLMRIDAVLELTALYVFLSTAFRETVKDERDARGDRAGGAGTPPTLKVDRRRRLLAAHLALAGSALLPIPLYLSGRGNVWLPIFVSCAAGWYYAASKFEVKKAEWMNLGVILELLAFLRGLT